MNQQPVTIDVPDPNEVSTYDKLILLKLYENRIKEIRAALKAELGTESQSHTTHWGKVTISEGFHARIDKEALYSLLLEKGQLPRDWGKCSVDANEDTLQRLISAGILSNDEASALFGGTAYTTMRVTPSKDAKATMIDSLKRHNLLESPND